MRRPRKYRIGERTRSQSVLFFFVDEEQSSRQGAASAAIDNVRRDRMVWQNRRSALRIAQRAGGYTLWFALLNGHPSRRWREKSISD